VKKRWKIIKFSLLAAVFIAAIVLLMSHDPVNVVSSLGFGNSYLIVFLSSLLGGISTFTAATYIAVISGFAVGGLNIPVMAVVAGLALFVGDYVFYILGSKAVEVLPDKWGKKVLRASIWLNNKPYYVYWLFIFLYTAVTPFPADILMILLAVSGIKFKKVWHAILLGDIAFILTISLLSVAGKVVF
jgi:membrane protein YqaA with SNARE-associated domain